MATVDLVLPVYNEEAILERSTETVLAWTEDHPEHEWRIVIADNASVDRTRAIAEELQERHEGRVVLHHIPVKGRGIALRIAFLTSHADVSAYMDVDLSTDIKHIPELVDPIAAGEVDIAYGTRLHADSETARGWRRETISRVYVQILRQLARLRVTDAQCGFKAISRRAARELVPLVEDTQWFWDSELLLIAQENGYRLREVPVRWVEDRDSRVAIARTAMEDLRGIWRLRRGGVPQVTRQPDAGA
ncbi:MAG: glycosyltransferase [Chloroflexi bacterium]|nr:glycosyltransferase [Chloroflexota bacterium]